MIIGTVKEIKKLEFRVGLTPDNVADYVNAGHTVLVEAGAGLGCNFQDSEYTKVGAEIVPTKEEVWAKADMIIKVKEPLPEEYPLIRENQILYTYLHLAADVPQAKAIRDAGAKAVAYETMVERGTLPCLIPMSQIAGSLAAQEGAKYLEKAFGGRGVLLNSIPGVEPANVVVLGGGTAGTYAAEVSSGMGAKVTIIDKSLPRLQQLKDIFMGKNVCTLYSTPANITRALQSADLVIGTVLIPGSATPQLILKEHIGIMKKGAVIVDVAIDQGGCAQTSRVTYHDDPVYEVDGIIHYCVGNMPGAVPLTSTLALTNATLAYGLQIANKGLEQAAKDNPTILTGLNYYQGKCTNKPVAEIVGDPYVDPLTLLG